MPLVAVSPQPGFDFLQQLLAAPQVVADQGYLNQRAELEQMMLDQLRAAFTAA